MTGITTADKRKSKRSRSKKFENLVGPTDPRVDHDARERLITARIGQTNQVQAYYMICEDSIDEYMRDILKDKQQINECNSSVYNEISEQIFVIETCKLFFLYASGFALFTLSSNMI